MSVVCDKCGEELMGAVNRCWKCGTTFAHVEADDQPPIRRAPILAAYLAPAVPQPAETIYLAETTDEVSPDQPASSRGALPPWLRQLDHASLATAALALVACGVAYYSAWGVPLGAVAVACGAGRIRRRRSWPTWAAFLLGICALLFALVRLMAYLYSAITGGNLFLVLFNP